jgi:glutathione-independent formaldehyde dehydrogenase
MQMSSNSNRGVVYLKPGSVEVRKIDFPSFRNPAGKTIDHGVILKVVTTNICGSDQHMVRGRTTAPAGMVLGHEITGEVIEKGRDVEYLEIGDLVSVPFNVACGRCRTCREGDTGVCLHVNSERAGGAYGYVDMGGWIGGQADYVMVPYADFNLLKFPDRARAMEKIRDLPASPIFCRPDFTEPSPPRSASDRRSTSPARGRSDLRPRHPRASLARPPC